MKKKIKFKLTCKLSMHAQLLIFTIIIVSRKQVITDYSFNNFNKLYHSVYVKCVHKNVHISTIPIFIL